jgi:Skp family chaperone for outer membrane proteins
MKTMIAALLLGAPAMVGTVADVAVPNHFATVSLQKLATESIEGRAANKQLQTLAQKMAAELAAKQKDMPQADFQKAAQQSQAEFANAQRQLQVEMRSKLSPILAEIAGQRGVDLVLNSDTAIAWVSPKFDITGEVLSRLNGTPSPAAPK